MIRRPRLAWFVVAALAVLTVLWASFLAWLVLRLVRFLWGATFAGMMPWWFAGAWATATAAALMSLHLSRWDAS